MKAAGILARTSITCHLHTREQSVPGRRQPPHKQADDVPMLGAKHGDIANRYKYKSVALCTESARVEAERQKLSASVVHKPFIGDSDETRVAASSCARTCCCSSLRYCQPKQRKQHKRYSAFQTQNAQHALRTKNNPPL